MSWSRSGVLRVAPALLLMGTLLIGACVPLARTPVGQLAAEAEVAAALGEWRLQSETEKLVLLIKFAGEGGTLLHITVREQVADGNWKNDYYEGALSAVDTARFLNIRYAEAGRTGWIPIQWHVDTGSSLELRMPDTDALAAAVSAGKIGGAVRKTATSSEVDLTDTGATLAQALTQAGSERWFGPVQRFERVR